MTQVCRSALLPYSASKMYVLVNDIDAYPQFIPWCYKCDVKVINDTELLATMYFSRRGIKTFVTTKNTLIPNEKINMHLVSGPFKDLSGLWNFHAVDADSCKVELEMEFTFSNKVYEMTIGPIFNQVANRLVSAFSERAHKLYA